MRSQGDFFLSSVLGYYIYLDNDDVSTSECNLYHTYIIIVVIVIILHFSRCHGLSFHCLLLPFDFLCQQVQQEGKGSQPGLKRTANQRHHRHSPPLWSSQYSSIISIMASFLFSSSSLSLTMIMMISLASWHYSDHHWDHHKADTCSKASPPALSPWSPIPPTESLLPLPKIHDAPPSSS